MLCPFEVGHPLPPSSSRRLCLSVPHAGLETIVIGHALVRAIAIGSIPVGSIAVAIVAILAISVGIVAILALVSAVVLITLVVARLVGAPVRVIVDPHTISASAVGGAIILPVILALLVT